MLAAFKQREENACSNVIAEWHVKEKVEPEALAPVPNTTLPFKTSAQELQMERSQRAVFQGQNCRLDENGEDLFALNAGGVMKPWQMEKIWLFGEHGYREYIRVPGAIDKGHGQTTRKIKGIGLPYDDTSTLPVFLFARPSWIMMGKSIANGDFEEWPHDPNLPSDGHPALVDKKWHNIVIYFDETQDYVPVKFCGQPNTTIDIEYALDKKLGRAPSKWIVTDLSDTGQPIRIWSATVDRWETDVEQVNQFMSYQFPPGTRVLDLDTGKPSVTSP